MLSTPVLVVIPARYASSRLPAKPLADLGGRPLIRWVYEGATKAARVNRVLVATDDERIVEAVRGFGGEVVMTSPGHPSGTDRVAEAAKHFDHPWILNLQGDLPMIRPEMIDQLIAPCLDDASVRIGTLRREILTQEELLSPHVVKVVTDPKGDALYFSRNPIPHLRDVVLKEPLPRKTFFKHYGLYLYRRNVLFEFQSLPKGRLEELEKLEQLRAMEAGIPIRVVETDYDSWEVDTPSDLEKVRSIVLKGGRI